MTTETDVQVKDQAAVTSPVSDEMLADLKSELSSIDQDLGKMATSRQAASDTRLCYWDGQSQDGQKHAEEYSDEDVRPFEGAFDQRVRLADMLTNEDVALLVLATIESQITVTPTEGTDIARAGRLKVLLRYLMFNHLGWTWVRELIKGCNYMLADSPGLAWMYVGWKREKWLSPQSVTTNELMDKWLEKQIVEREGEIGDPLAMADEFLTKLANPLIADEELTGFVKTEFDGIDDRTASRIVRELRTKGLADFPQEYTKEGLDVEARRMYEDFFISRAETDFQMAPMVFMPEWLSKAQVLARAAQENWAPDFVKQLLTCEGKNNLPSWMSDTDIRAMGRDSQSYTGRYQVVHALMIRANSNGALGRYVITFHKDISISAGPERMIPYAHGKYPGHMLQREALTKWLFDSRGIPEVVSTQQQMIKVLSDDAGNNAQVGALPPLITVNRKTQGQLYLEQMGELAVKRDGDVKFMQPPAFPVASLRIRDNVIQDVDDYFGRENKNLSNVTRAATLRRFKILWWMANVGEIMKQILQVAQEYMPDEMIERVTNEKGDRSIKSRAEIQGSFDVVVSYDSRDLDGEDFERRMRLLKDMVMAMDKKGVIDATPIVESYLWRLEPSLAGRSLRDEQEGTKDELEQEMENWQKILAGVEPEMVTDGSQNYQIRLGMYEELKQKNPQIYASLPPDRAQILNNRLQHLAMMVRQFGENVQIGRTGVTQQPMQGGMQQTEPTEQSAGQMMEQS